MSEAKHMKRYSVGPIGALEAQTGVPDDGLWVTATVAREMLEALKAAKDIIAQEIKDIGPCDHPVNHCICGLVSELDRIERIIAKAEGKEADRG